MFISNLVRLAPSTTPIGIVHAIFGVASIWVGLRSIADGTFPLLAIVVVGVGVIFIVWSALTWRYRHAHRNLLTARAAFRAATRALDTDAFYVNPETGLIFRRVRQNKMHGVVRIDWWDFAEMHLAVERGERAPLISEEFAIVPGNGPVWRWVEGSLVEAAADGSLRFISNDHRRLRPRLFGVFHAVFAGFIDATETELRELCDQIAGSRKVNSSPEGNPA